jgi:methionine synthase II (cobalamin-independent)
VLQVDTTLFLACTMATGAHFVGSVPLSTAKDVFKKLTSCLPNRLVRIPDGEPAERLSYVVFQRDNFSAVPQVLRQYDASFNPISPPVPTKGEIDATLKTLNDAGPLQTQYDTHALASWEIFKSLQADGTIPSHVKFQVSLPTPYNTVCLIADVYQAPLEPVYEEALMRSIRNIEANIPHSSLAIQFDVAGEFAMLEGITWPHFRNYWEGDIRRNVIDRVARLCNAVSPSIDTGLHLCYGDMSHQHFIQPKDIGKLVDIALSVKAAANRDITYIHMPVPKDRADDAYFAPLKDIDLGKTMLYLGLVHYDDLEGTKLRIATAKKAMCGRTFGVATECGMGRTPPEQLDNILEITAAVAGPVRSVPHEHKL